MAENSFLQSLTGKANFMKAATKNDISCGVKCFLAKYDKEQTHLHR